MINEHDQRQKRYENSIVTRNIIHWSWNMKAFLLQFFFIKLSTVFFFFAKLRSWSRRRYLNHKICRRTQLLKFITSAPVYSSWFWLFLVISQTIDGSSGYRCVFRNATTLVVVNGPLMATVAQIVYVELGNFLKGAFITLALSWNLV